MVGDHTESVIIISDKLADVINSEESAHLSNNCFIGNNV